MPELTLTLPAALGLLALFVAIGASAVFFTLRSTGRVVEPTASPTVTTTATATLTPTMTQTATLVPTFTPIPPVEYTVQEGDYCSTIAGLYGVSVMSIVDLNQLGSQCILAPGMKILVPMPTPTASPEPTTTPSGAEATESACPKDIYTVKATDTLSTVSLNYDVPMASIKEYNGMASDIVWEGMRLVIPLCQRNPTPGPTPTATLPPPYQAPNLLLPADGASFTLANDNFTLQWASVGTLRSSELYQVTIVDLTDVNQRRLTDYVTDTKYIVPSSFRPNDNIPHVMKWWVSVVRQSGNDTAGKPIYESAGEVSEQRAFSWIGAAVETTPTP
jgi:LysM repeat protein